MHARAFQGWENKTETRTLVAVGMEGCRRPIKCCTGGIEGDRKWVVAFCVTTFRPRESVVSAAEVSQSVNIQGGVSHIRSSL